MLEQPFGIASLIFLVVSVPLIAGVIPRNRFYGVRTRDTLTDAGLWRAGNRFGATAVLLSSLAYLFVALGLPYQRSAPDSLSGPFCLPARLPDDLQGPACGSASMHRSSRARPPG